MQFSLSKDKRKRNFLLGILIIFLFGISITILAVTLGGCCQSNNTTNLQKGTSIGYNLSPSDTLPYSGKNTTNSPKKNSPSKKSRSGSKSPHQKSSGTSPKSLDGANDLDTPFSGKDSNNTNSSSSISTSGFTVDGAYKFLKDPAAASSPQIVQQCVELLKDKDIALDVLDIPVDHCRALYKKNSSNFIDFFIKSINGIEMKPTKEEVQKSRTLLEQLWNSIDKSERRRLFDSKIFPLDSMTAICQPNASDEKINSFIDNCNDKNNLHFLYHLNNVNSSTLKKYQKQLTDKITLPDAKVFLLRLFKENSLAADFNSIDPSNLSTAEAKLVLFHEISAARRQEIINGPFSRNYSKELLQVIIELSTQDPSLLQEIPVEKLSDIHANLIFGIFSADSPWNAQQTTLLTNIVAKSKNTVFLNELVRQFLTMPSKLDQLQTLSTSYNEPFFTALFNSLSANPSLFSKSKALNNNFMQAFIGSLKTVDSQLSNVLLPILQKQYSSLITTFQAIPTMQDFYQRLSISASLSNPSFKFGHAGLNSSQLNSCFFNSSVQIFMHCPLFGNLLEHVELENGASLSTDSDAHSIANEFISLYKNYWSSTNTVVSNGRLYNLLHAHDERFELLLNAKQQDAGELLIFVIDLLKNYLEDNIKLSNEYDNLFYYRLQQTRTCKKKGHSSNSDTNDNIIKLHPIAGDNNIADLLKKVTADEEVEYRCDSCHDFKDEKAIKKFVFTYLPRVLLVNVITYKEGHTKMSVNLKFTHPAGKFHIQLNDTVYRCLSFIVHAGSTASSGHYYTYTRDANNDWYYYSDTTAQQVNEVYAMREIEKAVFLSFERL